MVNIPIRAPWLGPDAWITVPPQGYGGVQWVVATLIDGLMELGHEVFLLGAPGSISTSPLLKVLQLGHPEELFAWLQESDVEVVHDSSNDLVGLSRLNPPRPYISTHHLTGRPANPDNVVYLSFAQRRQAGATEQAPIIRIPVNPSKYIFREKKEDYLLFLGRVSRWKGALEAARFAHAAGLPLIIAGPAWEEDYLNEILGDYGDTVKTVGEVGGEERLALLAGARALLVMSQTIPGPWGDEWCEPGATVVSEAAASGTPVISTNNGCLAEITPHVGVVLPQGDAINRTRARDIVNSLPPPLAVRAAALREWDYISIAKQYEDTYRAVIQGVRWS